ncbi:hypothetical protein [Roseococcus microcysteis]|uniref:hypothetical protein n=1 Tax=Roseococcus microcysteis TaxID=2771361 RepID=UPI001CC64003|nr:hypothetical protein [Roseococcus microcysteis]
MVRALLAGRKTQTRRLAYRDTTTNRAGETYGLNATSWKRVQPGDRLWVRENYARVGDNPDDIHACPDLRVHAYYAADSVVPAELRWRPSIHMPRWASRLTLTVTAVRVERLQAISEADAKAEGYDWRGADPYVPCGQNAVLWFSGLWNTLHKPPHAWADNPEVVAITFTVAQRNIDHG